MNANATPTRPIAALFSTYYLAYSQTFIHEELRHHERYDVEVFSHRAMNLERFPHEPLHAIEGEGQARSRWQGAARRVEGLVYQLTRYSPRFEALFRSRRYALVHGHFGPGSIYAMRYAERFDLPLVVTFHGYDVGLLRGPRRWRPRHLRYLHMAPRLLERMTLGLCASNELRELLIEAGADPARLVVHRLGVDLSRFKPVERPPRSPEAPTRVIMIGRFVEKKGHAYAVRAFARQLEAGRRAHLTLVGDGEKREAIVEHADRLGVREHVTFTGAVTGEEVARLLRESDILLAPSVVAAEGDRESGVIVIKEASACGVVPVGTYHGGIPEIIDDAETGFLVPERDVASLADRLGRLIDDPALRARFAVAGRAKMVGEYDQRERVRALEARYDEAVARHRERAR